jgi:peptidyl-prolyl cis-trans isomerase C
MLSRQAICTMLASAATLLAPYTVFAQAKFPATPPPQPQQRQAVPIIPVSLRNDQIAATVNGEKILVGEVRRILDERPYTVPLAEEQKKVLREEALKMLIDDALMRQYLAKYQPQVNQADFNKEYKDLADALKAKGKSMADFHKESGQSEEELRRDIVALLQWRAILGRFYPDDKAKVYYEANKVFFDKVMVRASHILVRLPANAPKQQVDQATQQLLVWRQDILAGKAKFADVAKQHSDCPSKSNGGDVGKFRWKFDVAPEFAQMAFSMKPGELSGVVRTEHGVHMILVTERSQPEPSVFASLKDTVREIMGQDDKLTARILADQRKNSDIKISLP